MFDHVTIRTQDRAASERFFEAVLTPLGIDTTYRTNTFSVWHDFAITVAGDDSPPTLGLHVGFVAPSREQVGAFWQAGVDAGYLDDGPPGPRPRYAADYYAAFLRDPDGNGVEAVHRDGPRRRDGVIDHLTIRVADLGAATASTGPSAPPPALTCAMTGAPTTRASPPATPADRSRSSPARPPSTSTWPSPATKTPCGAFTTTSPPPDTGLTETPASGLNTPGYYAAYVLDPDGNNIEVVDHHRHAGPAPDEQG
jgi:catechol 2,3-dioxygenase-like lactoylglutathione lyase family enzyme